MGSLKRKETSVSDFPSKKAKSSKDSRPFPGNTSGPGKPSAVTDGRRSHAAGAGQGASGFSTGAKSGIVSVLNEEEPMFPRGGKSVLTPLEQKHIALEAKADALKELELDVTDKSKQKRERKRKLKNSSAGEKSNDNGDEEVVKVESLNFKRLVKGSLVLGQICGIGFQHLTIALPNNLTGTVSIAAISDVFTSKLQQHADASDGESDEEQEDDGMDLQTLFEVGQYVRAYVLSTKEEESSGKGKRHIDLSLRPTDTNSGLSKDDLVANITVMAAVSSVQDHGYEMELGIGDGKIKGFLSKKSVSSDIDEMRLQPGAVSLCLVKSVSGKIAQLSLDTDNLRDVDNIATEASTINSFQPGTAVDILVTTVSGRGLVGKLLGHLPVTADLVHSGAGPDGVDLESVYKVGSRAKARVICTFATATNPKLGISLLPHIVKLQSKLVVGDGTPKPPLDVLPIASFVEECTIRNVEPGIGLYVDIGVAGLSGFVHISRVKDGKVDALYESSGPFQVESTHRGRIVGYSAFDGMFLLSLEKSVLDQRFIRLEDVPVGEVVTCTIEKVVVGGEGVQGLVVKLADGVTGYVHETHLADVRLQHPERKFREGMSVKARVLSVRPRKRQMRLTLKKSLVNSDVPIITSYDDVASGSQALGTISDISSHGARIEFYRGVRGFLPVSQMSEAYIRDPKEHFRIGQVVNVHVLDVDPEAKRLVVSCKDPSAFGLEKQAAMKAIHVGNFVTGTVSEKTEDEVFVDLEGSGLKAILPVGQLTDKSANKSLSALKKIHVGQTLSDLMVLDKNERRRAIILTLKPSLLEAGKAGTLLRTYADARVGDIAPGFISSIRPNVVLVQFGGNLVAVMFKGRLAKEDQEKENFGLRKHQSISTRIIAIDTDRNRLVVAPASSSAPPTDKPKEAKQERPQAHGPVQNITFGQVVDVRVVGIHETQLNVETADKVQGRVDVSQIFDSWSDIQNPSQPLSQFKKGDTLRARAIGLHDAKDHRFLAFSHRSFNSVVEFTAKPKDVEAEDLSSISLDKLQVGSTHLAYVNNALPNCLWVNISPVVRGRISAMDASDDISKLGDLASHFPIGSALQVRVTSVDPATKRLDLSARSSNAPVITLDTLKPNMVLPGHIVNVNERQIIVKLGPTVSGLVHLVDMSDNYDDVNTLKYSKGDLVQVSVVEVDKSNKKVRLSLRPSRVLNSASPIVDPEIIRVDQVSPGSLVRGFVKHVGDKGLFVLLGGSITALVKIANLSDRFIKDWKSHFQVDELVKGRVISVDRAMGQVELSLKASVTDENYQPPTTYHDLKEGQVVTGKIRKVEDFGVFIVIDGSDNVSGLCHRSEMADKAVSDARKLYQAGDVVKAKILNVDAKKKRISFGLKPAYFDDDTDMDDDDAGGALESGDEDEDGEEIDSDEGDDVMNGVTPIKFIGTDNVEDSDDENDNSEGGMLVDSDAESDTESDDSNEIDANGDVVMSSGSKRNGQKYDWTGDAFGGDSDDEKARRTAKKDKSMKKTKTTQKGQDDTIQVDRTADLDVNGPQTTSDYERLLLGQPDSSELWIAYMALQMQVSELTKAREVAERAIQTINMREVTEKLNVWIAYLNLEVAYGTKETVEEVFKRACVYNDDREVHERLATIYIQSSKHKEADRLFQSMVSKYGNASPTIWTNYAHFLHVTMAAPDRARALLPRATQAVGQQQTAALMAKFGSLEFRSPNGDPERGRTTFETILATWPKRFDLWNQLADLETSAAEPDATAIRDVFERGTKAKGLKPQRAMKWFQKWAEWEGKQDTTGKGKGKEKVMAKAQAWVAAAKARKAAAAEEEAADDR